MKVIDVVRMFMNEEYIKEEKENLKWVLSESFIKGGYKSCIICEGRVVLCYPFL